ncbi:MAG: alpha/beta hydrolase family protein [Anaerolineae bacterium]
MEHGGVDVASIDARHLNQRSGQLTYELPAYGTLSAWEKRAAELRDHIAAITGLVPQQELRPTWVTASRASDGPGYAVDRVALLGPSGLACTGNLYRPARLERPVPAILNPHGHWDAGRFEHSDLGSVRARCITFARMGMLALSYDMVGYNDSLQIPDHHFRSRRGALWGLTSLTMQVWNGLLALEFLCGLDEVDGARIGITGASGGASQALLLTALDSRIRVTAPVNMISAHFQGGCECENTPGLRVDTGNVEIAALAAPRPMLMVSATGDWTCNTPDVEYPAIRSIYALYEHSDRVAHVQIDAGHNYNADSRANVYRWFARWFGIPELEAVERVFPVDPDECLRVFPGNRLPAEIPDAAQLPFAWRVRMVKRQEALWPATRSDLERLSSLSRRRLIHILGLGLPTAEERIAVHCEPGITGSGCAFQRISLGRPASGERIECIRCLPPGQHTRSAVLVDSAGSEAYVDDLGQPGELVLGLLAKGCAVYALEPFGTNAPPNALAQHDSDWYWASFNRCLAGEQVQDILVLLAYIAQQKSDAVLIGRGSGALWSLLAAALSPGVAGLCADLTEFDLDADETYLRHLSVPLARGYDIMASAAAIVAPRPQMVGARSGWSGLRWAEQAYGVMDANSSLETVREPLSLATILSWKGLGA